MKSILKKLQEDKHYYAEPLEQTECHHGNPGQRWSYRQQALLLGFDRAPFKPELPTLTAIKLPPLTLMRRLMLLRLFLGQ